jgi:hypothetical protein
VLSRIDGLPVTLPGNDFSPLQPVAQSNTRDGQSEGEKKSAANDVNRLAGVATGDAVVQECCTGYDKDQGEEKS